MSATPVITESSSLIEATVSQYFESFSSGDFGTTASLFDVEGVLYPPFDQSVTGSQAIASYLEAEARGMQVELLKQSVTLLAEREYQCSVVGTVHTGLFSVNVNWEFVLSSKAKIRSVKVKLLATLQDLLAIKQTS